MNATKQMSTIFWDLKILGNSILEKVWTTRGTNIRKSWRLLFLRISYKRISFSRVKVNNVIKISQKFQKGANFFRCTRYIKVLMKMILKTYLTLFKELI